MPKRKKSLDLNQLASQIVEAATSPPGYSTSPTPKPRKKNPAAVALGQLGGRKGGPARAKKLSPEKRKEIAKKAAESRWNKKFNISRSRQNLTQQSNL
jgi:hypothetical protein